MAELAGNIDESGLVVLWSNVVLASNKYDGIFHIDNNSTVLNRRFSLFNRKAMVVTQVSYWGTRLIVPLACLKRQTSLSLRITFCVLISKLIMLLQKFRFYDIS